MKTYKKTNISFWKKRKKKDRNFKTDIEKTDFQNYFFFNFNLIFIIILKKLMRSSDGSDDMMVPNDPVSRIYICFC